MSKVLLIAAALLIIWGAGVFVTGDYVATLDISANLVSAGVITAALAAIAHAIEKLPARLAQFAPLSPGEAEMDPMDAEEEVSGEEERAADLMRERAEAAAPVVPPPLSKTTLSRPAPNEPALVREGVIDGRVYRYYDDGSIHADGPDGARRFASIDELRAEILGRARERAGAPAVSAVAGNPGGAFEAAPDLDAADDYRSRTDPGLGSGFDRPGELRGSFDDSEALADPHVEEPQGSSWAGPFRSLLSRGRRDKDGTRDDSEPRF